MYVYNYLCLLSRHESISGYYRTSAYFLAKLIGDLIPQRTIPTILYSSIAYWMIGKFEKKGGYKHNKSEGSLQANADSD